MPDTTPLNKDFSSMVDDFTIVYQLTVVNVKTLLSVHMKMLDGSQTKYSIGQLFVAMWSTPYYHFTRSHEVLHMSEFPELQQESAAACENRDLGLFREGPKRITTILTFNFLINPGVELWKHSVFKEQYYASVITT